MSIPVGLVGSLFSRFAHGIGVSGTAMGDVLLILGMFSVLVSIGDAEFAGPTPYYWPNSPIVKKQYCCHKDNIQIPK